MLRLDLRDTDHVGEGLVATLVGAAMQQEVRVLVLEGGQPKQVLSRRLSDRYFTPTGNKDEYELQVPRAA